MQLVDTHEVKPTLVDQFGDELNSRNAGKIIGLEGQVIEASNHKMVAQVEALSDEDKMALRGQLLDTYGYTQKMSRLSATGKYHADPQTINIISNLREIVRMFDAEFVADLEEHAKAGTLPVRKEIELRAMLQHALDEGAREAKEKGWSQGRATTHLEKIHRNFYKEHYGMKIKSPKGAMQRRLIAGEKASKVARKAAQATRISDGTTISF